MYAWGQLWCVDCCVAEAKSAAGISDERVWPETERLIEQRAPYNWEQPERDFIPNRDESHVPEGGFICKYDVMELERWVLL